MEVTGPDSFESQLAVLLWCGMEGQVVVSTEALCGGGSYESPGVLCDIVMDRAGYVAGEGCTEFQEAPWPEEIHPQEFVWASTVNDAVFGQTMWSGTHVTCTVGDEGEQEIEARSFGDVGVLTYNYIDGERVYWLRIDSTEHESSYFEHMKLEGNLHLCPGDDPYEVAQAARDR